MTTHSRRLRAKLALLEPDLNSAAAGFWTHPEFVEIFPVYLRTLHSSVRASVPLLLAASQVAEDLSGDPVAALLAAYYTRHAEEERDHDEWLLDDAVAVGLSREEVLGHLPSATLVAMIGAQYYWIHHTHPVALMGYLAVLERPQDPEYYGRVRERTGLPAAAFRTLEQHAELDTGHQADLDAMLDSLPLDERLERLVGVSAMHTVARMAEIFREITATEERLSLAV